MSVEIVVFTWDCRIEGAIPLADDRMTDMLNGVSRIAVREATVTDLDSGTETTEDVEIETGDMFAVVATGRHGMTSRRRRTVATRIRVDLGRLAVTGFFHRPVNEDDGPTTGRPETVFAGRELLVPLTCCAISYQRRGRVVVEEHATILINRSLAAWVDEPGEDEDVGRPSEWLGRSRYLKDLTGLPSY